MLKKKSNSLFAEVSHYEIRMARTDRTAVPIRVESLASIPVQATTETRHAVEAFAGHARGSFCQAMCAVYPRDRFLHRYYGENAARSKADDFAEKTLQSELRRDPAKTAFRLIHPPTGSAYDPQEALSREIYFVGAGRDCILEEQKRLIELGLYPTRLEIASVALFAGAKRALLEEDMDASALLLEFSEKATYGYVVNLNGLALSHMIDFGIGSIADRIKKELGLHDILSARKVMLSKTFDFQDMASKLLEGLITRVRASSGQFEVQTGRSVRYLFVPGLPESLDWIGTVLAGELGMERWKPQLGEWLDRSGITLSEAAASHEDLHHFLPLFSQMAKLDPRNS
ncbi:MAG: hypothetical protein ACLFRP_00060 [Puniceicoccaceae bacterium]